MTAVVSMFGSGPPKQDYIVLNNRISPGRASVNNAGDPRKWDERQGYGTQGAFLVYQGDKLPRFDVVITLWEEKGEGDQWDNWEIFATQLVKPAPGPGPKSALTIAHPILTLPPLNITAVVVDDVTQFVQDDDGEWNCSIKFIVYRPPIAVVGKVNQAIPPAALGLGKLPRPAEIQMDRLREKRDGLAGRLTDPLAGQ